MNNGLTRKEQWALLGLVVFIFIGLALQQWRNARNGPNDIVSIEGEGHWRKLAEIEATEPQAGMPALGPATALATSPLLPGNSEGAVHAKASVQAGATPVDINQADAAALETLPGIGPAKAAAIIELRTRLGGFRSPLQLGDVQGIGDKTLARLLPLIMCSATQSATTATVIAAAPAPIAPAAQITGAAQPPVQPAQFAQAAQPVQSAPQITSAQPALVRINTASAEELETLPGIGPAIARRIIEDRNRRGPFRRAADLDRVSGIGPAKLRQIMPYISAQ